MEAHKIATDEYDHIKTIIDFEIKNPSETIQDPALFYEKIKASILDIKKKCNYIIPNDIQEKYELNKLNNYFKHKRYEILDEAYSKKAEDIKIDIYNSRNNRINMGSINTKMTYKII